MKKGDIFTIEGCGLSARGHPVVFGKSVKTGRKMKVKTLTKFKVNPYGSEHANNRHSP